MRILSRLFRAFRTVRRDLDGRFTTRRERRAIRAKARELRASMPGRNWRYRI